MSLCFPSGRGTAKQTAVSTAVWKQACWPPFSRCQCLVSRSRISSHYLAALHVGTVRVLPADIHRVSVSRSIPEFHIPVLWRKKLPTRLMEVPLPKDPTRCREHCATGQARFLQAAVTPTLRPPHPEQSHLRSKPEQVSACRRPQPPTASHICTPRAPVLRQDMIFYT